MNNRGESAASPNQKSATGLKVLIITYYWPPAGGPGVQRWLLFVKYLRDFGITPVVYVPENPHYPLLDSSFKTEVPEDITVLKRPIKEPYGITKLFSGKKTKKLSSGILSKHPSLMEKVLLWIRGNFFIPDARVLWVKPSVSFLKDYLKNNPADVIITTGPPHSLHLIGLQLQKKNSIPWLADFRDPWTTIGYHQKLKLTPLARKKHKRLEEKVLKAADLITVTSPRTKEEFEAITTSPVRVITNGFDTEVSQEQQLDPDFTVSHIGSLLTERNPEVLWEAFAELSRENDDFRRDFKLQLAGTVSEDVLKSIRSFGLGDHLKYIGYLSHPEAIKLQRKSQVLLLLEIDKPETRAILPGKLFEYMAANRPILALGPEGSDIEKYINSTNTGFFTVYADKKKLKEKVLSWYREFQKGSLQVRAKDVEKFSRKNITAELAGILRSLKQ